MGTGSIPPVGPLGYEGVVAPNFIARTFNPLPQFNTFPLGTIWINTSAKTAFMLVNLALGTATWIPLGISSSTGIQTITTPDSVVVLPISDNVNFLESGTISITGAPGNISFSVVGGGLNWNDVVASPQALVPNNGYVADSASPLDFTLPPSCPFGSIFYIVGRGSGGWTVSQGSGQSIYFGIKNSTTGPSGSINSTDNRDCVILLCVEADIEFQIIDAVGDINFI